jgi:aspartate 1-decarboxylase
MLRTMLRSKIGGLTVTGKELYYEGSLTLDVDLLEKADIAPGEQIEVLNLNNGARITTYTIVGKRESGCCILNGPAARCGEIGDRVIVLCYGLVEQAKVKGFEHALVKVNEKNRPV